MTRNWTLTIALLANLIAAINISCARKENDTDGMPDKLPIFKAVGKNGFCVRAYLDLRNHLTSDYNEFASEWDQEKQTGKVVMDLDRVEELQGRLTDYVGNYKDVECNAKCTKSEDGKLACSHDEQAGGEVTKMTNEAFPPMLEDVTAYVTERKARDGQGIEPAQASVIETSWTVSQVQRSLQAHGDE